MSLLRLLTAGKSLVDLKNSTSRYRMQHTARLPKFGSPKNPFVARSETPSVQAAPGAAAQGRLPEHEMTPAEVAAAQLKQTRRLPILAPARAGGIISRPGLVARVLNRAGQLAQRLNPLSRWLNRKSSARPAFPGLGRPAVQGELSLDRIKVVRNDLNDADVEIVPAKPVAKTKAEPAAPAGRKLDLATTQPG
jgi:hypothetical protein